MNIIYTIRYTSFSIDEFINILTKYDIKCIIDVRSYPFSQFYEDYDKSTLEGRLKKEDIEYRNHADEMVYYHSEGLEELRLNF